MNYKIEVNKNKQKNQMMDYYSQYPGPTRDGAVREIHAKIDRSGKKEWLKKYVVFYVDDEISKYGGLGSQTGWAVRVETSIWNNILYKENLYRKVKQILYLMRARKA